MSAARLWLLAYEMYQRGEIPYCDLPRLFFYAIERAHDVERLRVACVVLRRKRDA